MKASLTAFLDGLIDYAGLFPPAGLPFLEAVERFESARDEPFGFAVARFICPASRLEELREHVLPRAGRSRPWRLSLLARPTEAAGELPAVLAEDLRAATALCEESGGAMTVDAVELRLPGRVAEDASVPELARFVETLSQCVAGALGSGGGSLFVEAALAGTWRRRTPALVEAVARAAEQAGSGARLGLKLRCGGLEPEAFPPVERLARALEACEEHRVAFKATAGLHHPVRHDDRELGVTRHGFFNLFGAGILLAARAIDPGALGAVLEERDPRFFEFDDRRFSWRGCAVPLDSIVEARRERMISFGSCSIDEPRDDLAALGLL